MDLSIETYGVALYSDGKESSKLKESGTFGQMVRVTNNSDEMATGVVVGVDLQAGLDVWEPDQAYTEYGTSWIGAQGDDKASFFGDPTTTDTTNGTVTVNDLPLAGWDLKQMDLENMPDGELIWELGTPLAPGESAMMTFHSQLSPIKAGGTDGSNHVYLRHSDQHDENPFNNHGFAKFKFGTPIALDLDGDGIETLSIDEGVKFDLLDSGVEVQTGWISGEDGLLAIDNNGNGQIDNGSELFGGTVGEGFSKLASFDSNDDGLVDSNDANFSQISVWQDLNENGFTDEGELTALESQGITALNTAYTNVFSTDAQGNILGEHSSATLADGSAIAMVDAYFQVEGE
jgi:hypothetical protein